MIFGFVPPLRVFLSEALVRGFKGFSKKTLSQLDKPEARVGFKRGIFSQKIYLSGDCELNRREM